MTEERIASLTIDGSQATKTLDDVADGFTKVGDAAEESGRAVETNTTRLRESDRAYERLLRSVGASKAAMEEFRRLASRLDADLERGILTADQHARALARLESKYKSAGGALGGLSRDIQQMIEHQRQMQAMVEATAGGWTRFLGQFNGADLAMARSNLINLTQQIAATGNATQALSVQGPELIGLFVKLRAPVMAGAAGFLAVAGAAAAVAGRIREINAEGRQLDATLRALNPTMRGFDARAESFAMAADRGVSRSQAAAALRAAVQSRSVRDAGTARQIAGLALDMGAVLGEDTDKVAARLADAFGKGAAGVKALDAELGFLTPELARTVRELDAAGRRTEAMGLAMGALRDRFGGAARNMQSEWGRAMGELGKAWDQFMERIGRSDAAQAAAGVARDVVRGVTRWLDPAPAEDPNARRMRELESQMNQLGGWLRTELGNGETGPAIDRARDQLRRLQDEYFGLAEAIAAARKAQEDFGFGQSGGWSGGQWNPTAPPAPAPNTVSSADLKRLDELRAAYAAEAAAMALSSAERQVRLAGLAAEREAVEAGRPTEIAREERLLAERKARDQLRTSVADQLAAERAALVVDEAMVNARGSGNRLLEAAIQAQSRFNDVVRSGGTETQAAEAANLSYRRSLAAINGELAGMALDQRRQMEAAQRELDMLGLSNAERAKAVAIFKAENDLRDRGVDLADAQAAAFTGPGDGDHAAVAAIFSEAVA